MTYRSPSRLKVATARRSPQRIEQSGDRIVISSEGVVHDMRADGALDHGVHDVAAADVTTPIHVVATFEAGVHALRPEGMPIELRRWLEGPRLLWSYAGVFTARLDLVVQAGQSPT
jgi:hypothetical protein